MSCSTAKAGSSAAFRGTRSRPTGGERLAGELYRVAIRKPETAGIFIIDTHPLDQDLWQGVKAMCALECIVPDGAVVIVVTPCSRRGKPAAPRRAGVRVPGPGGHNRLVEAGRLDKVTAHNIVQGGRLVERTQAFMVSPGIADGISGAWDSRRLPRCRTPSTKPPGGKGASARVIILGMGGEICPVAV